MESIIRGLAYVVGDAIDTDQIIPAEHLVYSLKKPDERRMYGRFAMSGVPAEDQGLPQGHIPFTDPDKYISKFTFVIGGVNFGCGSSREHAPFALTEAGAKVVVAQSYARIFYRNTIDGGFVIPFESHEKVNHEIRTGDRLELDTTIGQLTNHTTGKEYLLKPLGDVADILNAGNVFEYARKNGLISAA
ncbi:MAG: 3-isopropylmalate dehydratase [Bacteroidetes bacterium]|nr:3-isopropylmalate dehydratase [Bacteroidota bacterium]MXW14851.1 3-isopropylmalate dehydratase [Rhodothermaceae bacterium]MDE2645556.1 3-isopropylmalate dehydratase [Bacteroidota bacterium]MXW32416.1 3-isopropylmalate dehydratase [Rhodothermaceae bacterium]MXZ17422.1 3-isopropylmalate dehydratase [Rhodothermaceae bacterium]